MGGFNPLNSMVSLFHKNDREHKVQGNRPFKFMKVDKWYLSATVNKYSALYKQDKGLVKLLPERILIDGYHVNNLLLAANLDTDKEFERFRAAVKNGKQSLTMSNKFNKNRKTDDYESSGDLRAVLGTTWEEY